MKLKVYVNLILCGILMVCLPGKVYSWESPFGIMDPYPFVEPIPPVYDFWLDELDSSWLRMGGAVLSWNNSEPQKGGDYDWSRPDNYITRGYANGNRNLVVSINPFNSWDAVTCHTGSSKKEFYMLPCDLESYSEFVRAAVERYDGDGVSDAPGMPVVQHWQVYNEPDLTPLFKDEKKIRDGFWADTPENYALLVKVTYQAIKAASPKAKVLLAGVGNFASEFAMAMMEELERLAAENPRVNQYYDIVDIHFFGYAKRFFPYSELVYPDYRRLEGIVDTWTPYSSTEVDIWMTEIGTYTGNPGSYFWWPFQSERDQAGDLLKRYVLPFVLGVKKVFWPGLTEWYNPNVNRSFEHVGLIYDGNKSDDLGFGVKKLSYYTYQLMVDILDGISLDNVNILIDGKDSVYVYKFIRDEQPVYIAWWDYYYDTDYYQGKTNPVIIKIDYDKAIVTEAVPNYERGVDVEDFESAFATYYVYATDGYIEIPLDDTPVFIEQSTRVKNQ